MQSTKKILLPSSPSSLIELIWMRTKKLQVCNICPLYIKWCRYRSEWIPTTWCGQI